VGKRLLETDPANPLTARLLAIAFNKAGVAAQAERYAKEALVGAVGACGRESPAVQSSAARRQIDLQDTARRG
jgi:hypothetical protein